MASTCSRLCANWSEGATISMVHATPQRRQKQQPQKQQNHSPQKKTGESTPIDPKTCWIIVGLGTLSAVVSAVFLVIIWWICCKGKNKKKASPSKKESGSKKNANDKAEQKYPGHAEKDPAVSPDDAPNETEDSEQMEMGILEEKQQKSTASAPLQELETVQQQNGGENSARRMERAPAMAAANLDNGAVRTNAVSDYVTITILTAQPSPTETVEDGNND